MIKGMKDFQLPTRLEMDKETASPTYGKFFAEPFERGFGTTIGNSLRRILLSSLPGAAVTSVKVEGVYHEFSTIPGVTEDITIIILNVKSLRLKLHSDKPKAIHLKKKGPGEVRASDITEDPDVTVLNPDLHIATLDKDGVLDLEMIVKPGRGYVPAERNKEEGLPIGVIPVDSIFSPIKRVNFHVESARVGRVTDYDKLNLEEQVALLLFDDMLSEDEEEEYSASRFPPIPDGELQAIADEIVDVMGDSEDDDTELEEMKNRFQQCVEEFTDYDKNAFQKIAWKSITQSTQFTQCLRGAMCKEIQDKSRR